MDIAISRWIINTFGTNKAFAQIANIFSWLGSKWVIIAVLVFLMCFKRTRKMAILTAAVTLLTFVLNDYVIKLIVNRPRPFAEDLRYAEIMNLIDYVHPSGSSMPSGHAAVAMACAVSMMFYSKKFGAPAICWAVLVGLSRVCLCAHYFTDVLVGFAVGAIIAVTFTLIYRKIESYYKSKQNLNKKYRR